MARTIALTVEYDGTAYVGWQSQDNGPSVQTHLNEALSSRLGEKIIVTGSGRTDSGVHALGQICSFQTGSPISLSAFREGINVILPNDIRVIQAQEAAPGFHPRRSAISKTYLYRLLLRSVGSALEHHRAWKMNEPLDVKGMETAARALVGTHDFTSFAAADAEPERIKTVHSLQIIPVNGLTGPEIHIEISGSGFLKQMVRTIVGSLVDVGRGHRRPEWIGEVLRVKDRQAAGRTAPAWGLYLKQVSYPKGSFLRST